MTFTRWSRGCQVVFFTAALLLGSHTNAACQTMSSADARPMDPLQADAARPSNQPSQAADTSAPPIFFPHPDATRYYIAGQANIIFQAHGPFHSPYQGPNSLLPRGEYKTSLVGTLYMAVELVRNPAHHMEAIYDEESAGGRGISEALGLAGFTNLDVVRNPTLGPTPYLARVQLHQTIGFTSKTADAVRGPFSLSTQVPERRLEFRVGKLGLPDFFDLNSIGTDSHLQFMNWTADNNGAWDYAADTRGYTYAAIAEYDDKSWSARYGLALMPTVANGIDLDWNLRRASGQNAELEVRHGLGAFMPALAKRNGVVRLLGFVNHANMGEYRQQNIKYLDGLTPTPDITAHPLQSTVKYGVGINLEQELTDNLRVYGRFGWNEGQHESYAYTEVDQTINLGGDYSGRAWGRANDKLGLTFGSNAIKRDHQAYLKMGGLGFLLGDGNLNYAREDTLESYYTMRTWRGLSYALDMQYITHPGYNQDRGPVLVESVRMHVDF